MTSPPKRGTRGPPGAYRKGYREIIEKMCHDGATDAEIADFLRVSVSTIYNWKHSQPEVLEAMKVGKAVADERVVRSFYQRAVGFEHDAVKIFMAAGEPVVVPYREYYPPDVTAGLKWLINRKPDEWRDVQKIEHGGPGAFEGVSDAELVEMVAQEAQLLLEDKSKKERDGTDNSGT